MATRTINADMLAVRSASTGTYARDGADIQVILWHQAATYGVKLLGYRVEQLMGGVWEQIARVDTNTWLGRLPAAVSAAILRAEDARNAPLHRGFRLDDYEQRLAAARRQIATAAGLE